VTKYLRGINLKKKKKFILTPGFRGFSVESLGSVVSESVVGLIHGRRGRIQNTPFQGTPPVISFLQLDLTS
jgi:hypothetical protein